MGAQVPGQDRPTAFRLQLRDQQLEGDFEELGDTIQVDADYPEEGALNRGDARGTPANWGLQICRIFC